MRLWIQREVDALRAAASERSGVEEAVAAEEACAAPRSHAESPAPLFEPDSSPQSAFTSGSFSSSYLPAVAKPA